MAKRHAVLNDQNRQAAKALRGITAGMIQAPGTELDGQAVDILGICGQCVSVRLASGPLSGKVRDVPARMVRPAAAFEAVQG